MGELLSYFPVALLGASCRGRGDRLAGAEWPARSGHHPGSGTDSQARIQDTARCGDCPSFCKAGVDVGGGGPEEYLGLEERKLGPTAGGPLCPNPRDSHGTSGLGFVLRTHLRLSVDLFGFLHWFELLEDSLGTVRLSSCVRDECGSWGRGEQIRD